MISKALADFWRHYRELDSETQAAARLAYSKFSENPGHPSLRFKKLHGHEAVWYVRINENVRAAGVRKGDTILWFWIGTHKEFDKLF